MNNCDRSTVLRVLPLSNGLWSATLWADGEVTIKRNDCKDELEALAEGLLMISAALIAERDKQ